MGGISNDFTGSGISRILIIVALLSGLGSGVLSLTGTDDRYRAADAQRDFEVRDIKLKYLHEEIRDLKRLVHNIDETHPPQTLIDAVSALTQKIHTIELRLARIERIEAHLEAERMARDADRLRDYGNSKKN